MPPEMFCFSSDYLHVEGTNDKVAVCERQLQDTSAEARSRYYGGVGDTNGLQAQRISF